jgi:lambda family phage minor tail protein L
MSIAQTINTLELGAKVDLYELDLTPCGYDVQFYWTPSVKDGSRSLFQGGIEYVPRGVSIGKIGKTSQDQPPEPVLTIGNVDKGGNALLKQYGDLMGAKVTRRRTFAQFLDDGAYPDPNARLMDEIWYIEQKTLSNRTIIQFALKSTIDLDGTQIPNRRVLKNQCTRVYRLWDVTSGTFLVSPKNPCPYAGPNYFKRNGDPTTDPNYDVCSKDFQACNLRFGPGTLPGWFFPGAQRLPQNG